MMRYEYRGQMLTLIEIAKLSGVNQNALRQRLNDGWTMERATSEPVRPRRSHRGMHQDMRFDRDMRALTFAHEHPGGATHEAIAQVLGITRARVQQIEAAALRKLAAQIALRHRVRSLEEAL